MPDQPPKITGETVRADFNDPAAVLHYTRAAHFLGLWESERSLIRRHFPDPSARLLEAGCGAGRVGSVAGRRARTVAACARAASGRRLGASASESRVVCRGVLFATSWNRVSVHLA